VIVRESTQTVAIADPAVAEAVRYMRLHLDEPGDVAALARRVGVSRRTLEYHFRRALGRSIREELSRLRLDQSLSLLRVTNSPMKQIGISVGFTDPANFTRFVRSRTGLTPSQFRKRHGQKRD